MNIDNVSEWHAVEQGGIVHIRHHGISNPKPGDWVFVEIHGERRRHRLESVLRRTSRGGECTTYVTLNYDGVQT